MTAGNAELEALAAALVKDLERSRSRLISGEIFHGQHGEFAERVWSFGTYLRAALDLLNSASYPPAFVTLRSAMEHHAVDHLLFLGNRYVRLIKDMTEESLEERQIAVESVDGLLHVTRDGVLVATHARRHLAEDDPRMDRRARASRPGHMGQVMS